MLGAIHGDIGVADQCFSIAAIFRKDADADAGRQQDFVLFDQKWFGERGQGFACDDCRVFPSIDIEKGDDEFVATQA